MMQDFKDKVVVVTGSASGIGYALAEGALDRGAKVVISDIREDTLAEAVASLSAVAWAWGLRSQGCFTALTVSEAQWANSAMTLAWSRPAMKPHRSATSRGMSAAHPA